MDKPIPAFYACYLLRSTIRHQNLYVGSTPHPVRRLRQHNGESKGGAARTARDSLRPWEMTCLVTGFPSQVAALQFEWAWQNAHLTRHISPTTRLTQARTTIRFSPKTGRMRKRTGRPRLSLTDRLANLHQLLQSRSFGRWPLRLTFYCEDVFRVWQKWTEHELTKIRSNFQVNMSDEPSRPQQDAVEGAPEPATGIYALDVSYKPLKSHLIKSQALLSKDASCVLCYESLAADGATSLVCPRDDCSAVGHTTCFASSFLQSKPDQLLPIQGDCPSCGSKLQWIDLVKELTLRMRAPKDVEKILKNRKGSDGRASSHTAALAAIDGQDNDEDSDVAMEDEDWHYLSSTEDDHDASLPQSDPSPISKTQRPTSSTFMTMSEPVIEDSDWDDAEVIY